MIRLEEVLNCERVMVYRDNSLRYISGLTVSETKVKAIDFYEVIKNSGERSLGYMSDIYDLVNMLDKSGAISKVVIKSFTPEKILDYLDDYYVPIDVCIRIADHYGITSFKEFLNKAKHQIGKLGCYIGDVDFNVNDKRHCQDLNVSSYLDLNAVDSYAYDNGMSYQEVYIEACDIINMIVLGDTTENVRMNLNLFSDDYICNSISQKEYDEVVLLSKALSYLLRYSNIVFEGLGIFCRMILNASQDSYKGNNSKDGMYSTRNAVPKKKNTIDYNSYEEYSDYEDDPFTQPMKKKRHTKLENFKDHM